MDLLGKTIGFAITGSYCTFHEVLPEIKNLVEMGANVIPILSYNVAATDTRFMKKDDLKHFLTETCGNDIIETIVDAEPIGPKRLLDLIIIAPCTGNSLAKLALGISDTPVTLAVKAHLRNQRPVLIAPSSNDALAANAKNIGILMNLKDIFIVPVRQDNYSKKPTSLVSDMTLIPKAAMMALDGVQLQPVIESPYLM